MSKQVTCNWATRVKALTWSANRSSRVNQSTLMVLYTATRTSCFRPLDRLVNSCLLLVFVSPVPTRKVASPAPGLCDASVIPAGYFVKKIYRWGCCCCTVNLNQAVNKREERLEERNLGIIKCTKKAWSLCIRLHLPVAWSLPTVIIHTGSIDNTDTQDFVNLVDSLK